jgi:radical SAM superfamily enzyme
MELQPNQKVLLQAPTSHMTEKIEDYADDGDISHITTLGTWLNIHRNNISDDSIWKKTVKNITVLVHLCNCLCLENRKKMALKRVVQEVAYGMNPGDDCIDQLKTQAEKACTFCTNEYEQDLQEEREIREQLLNLTLLCGNQKQ